MINSNEKNNWYAIACEIGDKIAEIRAREAQRSEQQQLRDNTFNIADYATAVTTYAAAIKATHDFIYDRRFDGLYSMQELSYDEEEKLRAFSRLLEHEMRYYMLNAYEQLVAAKRAAKRAAKED